MKEAILAAALALGGATMAQAQMDPNGPAMPPGDGITMQGTNPEGQAYTPSGFNQGINVYPSAAAAPGMAPGMAAYPACTNQVKDRCMQTYTRWAARG